MSSRAGLRLQLMREQAMQDNTSSAPLTNGGSQSRQTVSNTIPIRAMNLNGSHDQQQGTGSMSSSPASGSQSSAMKSSPIIISQPIKFTGSRLVHLPPQIIHVQRQGSGSSAEGGGLPGGGGSGGSMPANLQHPHQQQHNPLHHAGTPPRVTIVKHDARPFGHHHTQQSPSGAVPVGGSRHSPAEFSPTGVDSSPQSASFTSAHSEFQIDDIIIDEILNLEEDQLRRRQQNVPQLTTSYSFADALPVGSAIAEGGGINGGGGGRQTASGESPLSPSSDYYRSSYPEVSSSAPTPTIDLDGEKPYAIEHEYVRDRRKKDIHNMIERRRRYNINDRIKELGMMLPKHTSEELKLNKGTILKASVDYIRALQRERENYVRLQSRQQLLEIQNRNYHSRIKDLEQQLHGAGLLVTPPQYQDPPLASSLPPSHRPIKQEPLEAPPEPTARTPTQPPSLVSPRGALRLQTGHFQSDQGGGTTAYPTSVTELSDSAAAMALSTSQTPAGVYAQQQPGSDELSNGGNGGGYLPQGDCLETPPVLPFHNQRAAPSFGQPQQQQQQQTATGAAPPPLPITSSSQYMTELYMDLNADGCQSPLMGGSDPMIGAVMGGGGGGGGPPSSSGSGPPTNVSTAGSSSGAPGTIGGGPGGAGQLSPDVQWDTQGFSPDDRAGQQGAGQQGPQHTQMDLS